jgi:SPP1 gp7 family putative phage head morphogenesis protein
MTTIDPNTRYGELLSSLLDKGYSSAAGTVVTSINRSLSNGVLNTRLSQLETEALRLRQAGERFTIDNPVLRALLADFEDELGRFGGQVTNASERLATGAESAAAQFTRQTVIGVVPRWNVPDPEAIAALAGYVTHPEWEAEIAKYAGDGVEDVRRIIINGVIRGRNPVAIARDIRRIVDNYPRYRAENMMRTLQMQAYRAASAVHQRANADILSYQIRVGTLDHRICMCCLSLHGTRLAVGEMVLDHYGGRCVGVAVVQGHNRSIQTGEEWYAAQDAETQRAIAGDANYEALRAGRVQLRDFVQPVNDPLYGRMITEASLVGIIGQEARNFYSR